MAKLIIYTQVYENYAWREDGSIGTGADAYWKAKGGHEYVIRNVDLSDVNAVFALAEKAEAEVKADNDFFRETSVGWEVLEDNELTEFEKSQLDYDGEILFPATELALA